jgi:pseudouridine-5'-phosphate glycosidase
MNKFKVKTAFKSGSLANTIFRHASYSSSNRLLENSLIEISHEIKSSNKPLVALESTIITHGLPFPANVDMALAVEDEIKSAGAWPATIAFLDGKFKVGVSRSEIERLAKSSQDAIKISRRDIPFLLANQNRNSIVGGNLLFLLNILLFSYESLS